MPEPRLGVIFLPHLPPEQLQAVALAADAAGLDDLWLWEDCFFESGIAAAGAVLAWTERLRVAIGLMPVPLRNVALTAMETATLTRLFPGRFELGIGHGVQAWMGQVGERVESPLTLFREYAQALRALLAGQSVSVSGRYVRLDLVQLEWPPAEPGFLWAGAIGPKSLALCGELGDGVVVTGGVTPQRTAEIRALVDAAAADVGRDRPEIAVYVIAATGPDAPTRFARELSHWSFEASVPVTDLGVAGDAVALAAGARRWLDAGADRIVFQPTRDDPDLEGFIRTIAVDVRALL